MFGSAMELARPIPATPEEGGAARDAVPVPVEMDGIGGMRTDASAPPAGASAIPAEAPPPTAGSQPPGDASTLQPPQASQPSASSALPQLASNEGLPPTPGPQSALVPRSAHQPPPSPPPPPPHAESNGGSSDSEDLMKPEVLSPNEYKKRFLVSQQTDLGAAAETGTDAAAAPGAEALLPHAVAPREPVVDAERAGGADVVSPREAAPADDNGDGDEDSTVRHARVNYASIDAGAVILGSNPEASSSSSLLKSDKDSYMLNPCSAKNKWVVVGLSEDVRAALLRAAAARRLTLPRLCAHRF